MIIGLTNTLRSAMRTSEQNPKAPKTKASNPSGLGIAAVLAALAVGGYVTWRLVRREEPATTGGGGGTGGGGSKLPTEPEGPLEPVEPTEPEESEDWVDYSSPEISLKMRYRPGQTMPYEINYRIDGVQDVGSAVAANQFFKDKADAMNFIDTAKWFFGRPKHEDDLFVVASSDLPMTGDLHIDTSGVRGSVWQDVEEGSFYISIRDPGGIGYLDGIAGNGYPGIDQAIQRMYEEIGS